jgi:hypothetical protein
LVPFGFGCFLHWSLASSQKPSLQASSGQSRGQPMQSPTAHPSATVQKSPSSQNAAEIGAWMQLPAGQESAVQGFWSSQLLQAAPALPQVAVVDARQISLSQQPVQRPPTTQTQLPALQSSPAGQGLSQPLQ